MEEVRLFVVCGREDGGLKDRQVDFICGRDHQG